MPKRTAPAHEKNYMIHWEPPGTRWGPNGLVALYDPKLLPKITDYKKPTLAQLEQGKYVFINTDGKLVHGEIIETAKDGAVIEVMENHMRDDRTWGPKRVLRRVKSGQVLATEEEFARRPLIRAGLGGRVLGLGYVPGTEPDGWMKVDISAADQNRPEVPML